MWARTGDYAILVPVASATDSLSDRPGYHPLPMKQNHSDMVKFSSRFDENYKLVKPFLEQFGTVAVDVIQKRFSMTQGKSSTFQKIIR